MKLNINRDRVIRFNTNPQWITLLGVILVLLKVFELSTVATWSWWLVLLPFYIGPAIFFGFIFGGAALFALGYGLLGLASFVENKYRKFKRRK